MLYIKEDVQREELLKHGFKRCKKPYESLYYLCLSANSEVIFIGDGIYIDEWREDDPRIHKKANCEYRNRKEYIDVLYDLIVSGLVESRC